MQKPTVATIPSASVLLILAAACAPATSTNDAIPPAEPVVAQGFFTSAQATRGRQVFSAVCSECHVPGDFRGADFEWTWRRQTAWDLYQTMAETMPEDAPGSLPPETYAAVIAYILEINSYADGSGDLAPTQESLDNVPLGPDVDKTRRSGATRI